MNKHFTVKYLPLLSAVFGIAALVARLGLFWLGADEKGLLVPGHPMDLLVWILTAAAVVLILAGVLSHKGPDEYHRNFTPSLSAGLGAAVLAVGMGLSVISGWGSFQRIDQIRDILGLLSVPALLWAGWCRFQGKRPFFLFHGVVCLYLLLFTISRYQIWSSHPQIQEYLFPVLGCLLLTLFAYQQTAFDVDLGKRQLQLGCGLLAVFFCLGSAAEGGDALLYVSGAIWALTNLCRPVPVRRRRNPAGETGEEDSK